MGSPHRCSPSSPSRAGDHHPPSRPLKSFAQVWLRNHILQSSYSPSLSMGPTGPVQLRPGHCAQAMSWLYPFLAVSLGDLEPLLAALMALFPLFLTGLSGLTSQIWLITSLSLMTSGWLTVTTSAPLPYSAPVGPCPGLWGHCSWLICFMEILPQLLPPTFKKQTNNKQ